MWWLWLVIPLVSGLVGWGTNWLAIQMTFYPLEFWPLRVWQMEGSPFGLFGWQGIIPAKAGQMAGIMCDLMLDKLLDVSEVFSRIDPGEVARLLAPGLAASLPSALDAVAGGEGAPTRDVWTALPPEVRAEAVREAAAAAPEIVRAVFAEIQKDVTGVLDLKAMVVRLAVEHKDRAVRLFQRCGTTEFPLIIHSGLLFGFLFGLVQALVAWFYNPWWVLPLFGFMVGYATNWVALKIIFSPVEPVKCGPWKWQGVFLTRQEEVSAEFAKTNAEFYLNASNLLPELLDGARSGNFRALVERKAREVGSAMLGGGKAAVVAYLGAEGWAHLNAALAQETMRMMREHHHLAHAHMDKALDLERTVREKLEVLPSRDFERVLHPAFEEDEIKLIVVGGVLGALAGFAQYGFIFRHVE